MAESILEKEERLPQPIYLIDAELQDWNSVSEVGWYTGYNARNKHSDMGTGWIQAICLRMNNNPRYNYVIAFGEFHIFIRTQSEGVWANWVKLV